jgi:hypothetical protein
MYGEMGLFDFFRNITKGKEKEKISLEKVSLLEINEWINKKSKEIEDKELKLYSVIKD